MERKIGETFDFEGKTLQVKESERVCCAGCFFDRKCYSSRQEVAGHCEAVNRVDNKEVIFVEIREEQQEQTEPQEQAEQPKKLNLCEILKHCPQGETFWSPMFDNVTLVDIDQEAKNIKVLTKSQYSWNINNDGTITIDGDTSPEIMLYPSREQRDWTKVKYEPKKERFDPKTFKAFDKVLVRLNKQGIWCCELFSFIEDDTNLIKCCGAYYQYCIPYNDDTKHLVGTKDEAPEFYRYWED